MSNVYLQRGPTSDSNTALTVTRDGLVGFAIDRPVSDMHLTSPNDPDSMEVYLGSNTPDGFLLRKTAAGMLEFVRGQYGSGSRIMSIDQNGVSVTGNLDANDVSANDMNLNSNLEVFGLTRLHGGLTVDGTMTTVNTETKLTDQFEIANAGTGPALIVNQMGNTSIAEFQDDSNVVVIIADDGRVGIGKQIPSEMLDVDGNVLVSSNVTAATFSGDGSSVTDLNANNVTTGLLDVARGGTGVGSHTADKLLVGGGTSAVTSPTDLHWDASTNMFGVNTSSPSHALDVTGTVYATSNVVAHHMLSLNTNGWVTQDNNGGTFVYNDYSNTGSDNESGTYYVLTYDRPFHDGVTIDFEYTTLHRQYNDSVSQRGRVRITETSEYQSASYINVHHTRYDTQANSNGYSTFDWRVDYSPANNLRVVILYVHANRAHNYSLNVAGRIAFGRTTSQVQFKPKDLVFGQGYVVYDSNITDWVTAPYSDHANTLDKIGVNTSTPAEALDVVGRIQASDQVLTFATDDATTPGYSWTGDNDTGMFLASSDVIAFSTVGIERMRVDDVGHVGIGVSSVDANSALHVDGDVRLQNADLVGACNIYTKTEVDDLIEVVDDNLAEGLYWDTETQRLGVSTVTPDAKLHVIGDTITAAITLSSDGSAVDPSLAWIADPDTGMYRIADDVVGLSSGGQEIVRVDTNGMTVRGDFTVAVDSTTSNGIFWNAVDNRLGINRRDPPSALYVDGDIRASGNVFAESDRRIKKDLEPIDGALDKVARLTGYTYRRSDKEHDDNKYMGLIAQEVLDVVPEVVQYDENADMYGVAYGNVVALLIQALKEQQAQIEEMRKRLSH